ncbi:terminase gpA endonuclease subunit [Maricaulis sp.]|uniref:terminase gpA endonuclease subunit n=1 Tax=Maricaulis sp. TaxID=1486257 RepID=UPI003A8F07DF
MADGSAPVPGGGAPVPLSVTLARNERDTAWLLFEGLRPPAPIDVAAWPELHVNFPEGAPVPGPYLHATAPYLREILEALSPDRPGDEIPVIKPAQSGGTVVADLWLSCCLEAINAPAMVIHPTVTQFKAWAERKYWPLIEATAPLDPERGGAVLPRHSRTEGGSTSMEIKFANGSSILGAGSNSAATLRQHTIRFMVKDDLDGWADNAEGEGDPDALADARLKTYRKVGMAKALAISTPLIARASRIMLKYQRSMMSRYYMACSGCGAKVDWDFEDIKDLETPAEAHLVCPACGAIHRNVDKVDMLAGGLWIATVKIDGVGPPKVLETAEDVAFWRERDLGVFADRPGFWITGVMNAFESITNIAAGWRDAKGDPKAEQVFYNTVLGRVYEVQTETPDWEALAARKEAGFMRGLGAWGPLVFTLTIDVQRDGLYFWLKGWNANEESWILDYGFLAGETAEASGEVWRKLHTMVDRGAPLPGGAWFELDRVLIDAKYNTDAVKAFVKKRRDSRVMAINGEAGFGKPLIYRATESEIKKSGKRRLVGGLKVWHIGTYSAKRICVARMNKTLEKPGEAEGVARGVYHFPADAEDYVFQQLTAEYIREEENKATGLKRIFWAARGDNHLFDCDVYSVAALEHIGARADHRGRWSEAEWAEREAQVRLAIEMAGGQSDMFDRLALPAIPPGERRSPAATDTAKLPSALERMAQFNRDE